MRNKVQLEQALEPMANLIAHMLVDMHYVAPEARDEWLRSKVTGIVFSAAHTASQRCPDGLKHKAMEHALTRVGDDIADKTCPLADVWWWDDGTTMAAKIAEVLE